MLSMKVFALATCLLVVAEARSFRSGRARSAPAIQVAQPAAAYAPAASSVRPVRQAEPEPRPEPYSFTFETTDEFGMTLTRTESGDENGNVKGSYMYRDPEGIYRTVEYGDSGNGFYAQVQTNEPGVISHKAADAEYIKS